MYTCMLYSYGYGRGNGVRDTKDRASHRTYTHIACIIRVLYIFCTYTIKK